MHHDVDILPAWQGQRLKGEGFPRQESKLPIRS